MPLYPAVSIVKPLTDYRLLLTFDNREERIFDVTPWLAKGAFRGRRSGKYERLPSWNTRYLRAFLGTGLLHFGQAAGLPLMTKPQAQSV